MPAARIQRPDVLVLGAGGVLGEAWMTGVLAGIEAAAGFDFRDCEHFVGTSAGSIVAATLAAGRRPRRPAGADAAPAGEDGDARPAAAEPDAWVSAARLAAAVTGAAAAPLIGAAVAVSAPAGAFARAALLARAPRSLTRLSDLNRRVAASGVRFDGRLRVVGVERERGRRVVFGSPGAPDASVADAVEASCAVPWLFEPVMIADRAYVDGGVWSPTNLDVAPAGRDTEVLCLHPTAGLAGGRALLGAIGLAARSATAVEALLLRRRGARVTTVVPDRGSAAAIGGNFMDPSPAAKVLAAGYRQGLALGG